MSLKSKIFNIVKKGLFGIYHLGSNFIPIKKNTIMFESSNGRNYTGNPRYIYEEILNQNLENEFNCIWVFQDTSTKIPGNAIKVKRSRFKYLFYSLRSEFWIFDSRHQYYLKKKKNTKYIQTWHGTALKKLGLDMDYLNMSGNTNIEKYRYEFKKNTSIWDYLISQNEYSNKIFKSAFDFKGEFLEIGYPRNDILINNNDEESINKIKDKLNIPKDKKIILYAPTWRDNEYHQRGEYKFATEMNFDEMNKELSDEYFLIVKYHYLVKDDMNWTKYKDFIIECDADWDIQELYLISDMMITDYSSVMFDYAILKRPMIFYTYDLENYKNNLRDFYFDMFEEVPGPIIKKSQNLTEYIKNFDINQYNREYREKYNKFNEKFNQFDKGTASKQVIELMLNK